MQSKSKRGLSSAPQSFALRPIGIIYSPFKKCAGTPIQSCAAEGVEGRVTVFKEFAEGLKDIEGFERIWLLYWFHKAEAPRLRVIPYLDTSERGLFATRAPCRPNPIGLSCVRLLGIEGQRLRISDMDILDNTPLLDIKPYVPRFDSFEVSCCGWLESARAECTLSDDRFERPTGAKEGTE